jgi:cell division protein FtsQ
VIQILPSGSLKMRIEILIMKIDFGKTINMERKFKNYKAFFQKAVLDSSFDKVKYKNKLI